MKKRTLSLGVLPAMAVGVAAVVLLKPAPPLKVPPPQQLQAVFPGDTRKIFEHGDKWTLLSLDPRRYSKGEEQFHGFRVMGKTQVSPEVKARLIASFYDAMVGDTTSALCFNPRHGIHAERNGEYIDFLICFQCAQYQTFPGQNARYKPIGAWGQPAFDRALKDAGISLAAK